jgi:hypothetical protein
MHVESVATPQHLPSIMANRIKAFTANFLDIKSSNDSFMSRFEDRFKVTLNGRSITPDNWYKVVAKAKKSPVRLLLSRR